MGFSSCGTWTQLWLTYPSAQAQSVWYMGLVALRHVESSQTRDGTCVICIGNWILLPLSHQGSPHLALLFVPIFALPTVSHAHSHILYLGISCLIFKASSNLTFSGKPSWWLQGESIASPSPLSEMTTHASVTICQLICLYWEFPILAPRQHPQQGQDRGVEQIYKLLVGWVVD